MKLKNKYGFTLIELLAVIVVLAIIALIATPIVMNTIESSKKGATIESVRNMVHAAELYFISEDPRYGKLNLLDDKLDYDGQKPELGEIEVNKDGNSRVYAYINGYCVTKEYDSELYASKTNKEECNWYATDNYETTEGTVFTLNNQKIKNYLIYGNSTQATRSGKNLYDYNNVPYFEAAVKKDNGYSRSGQSGIRFYTYQTLENYIGQTVTISFDLTTSEDGEFLIYQYQANGIGIKINKTNKTIYKTMKANVKQRVSVTGVVEELGTTENYSKGEIIVHKEGYTGSYLVNNIQFELGSSATAYEEYGAMPSPKFPSEIKNTGDLLTKDNCVSYGIDACDNIGKYVVQVKATGKNLFDLSALNWVSANGNNIKYSFNNNSVNIERLAENNTSAIYATMTFKPGVYTISLSNIPSDYKGIGNFVYSSIFGAVYKEDENGIIKKTFTLTEPKTDVVYFYMPETEHKIGNKITYNVQIEEGTSATAYEEYKEKLTNIYLTEPLRKVGDNVDYIDYANGKVVRNIKSELVANKTWNYRADDDLIYYTDSNIMRSNYANSNYFLSGSQKTGTNPYVLTVNNVFRLYNKNYWSSLDSYKTWLNNHQDLVVEYPLATPIEESIDLPGIELLDGYSTLSINTEVSPSNVKLTTTK